MCNGPIGNIGVLWSFSRTLSSVEPSSSLNVVQMIPCESFFIFVPNFSNSSCCCEGRSFTLRGGISTTGSSSLVYDNTEDIRI